jgi:ABC-type phosphate transport system substrate-binding protein
VLDGVPDQFDPVVQVQLAERVLHVVLHGAVGQHEPGGDLLVGHAGGDHAEDLGLAFGQPRRVRALPGGRGGQPPELAEDEANVFNLTAAQLRDIFLGTVTNWSQVNGADLPIRIVARTTGSGTRRAFDQKVLGGGAEPPFSSYDCVSKNAVPASPVIRCEVSDTSTLLQRVNTIPGAIGYAQLSDAATYPNVEPIKIDGWDPNIGAVERGSYPFWTVEYLYTSGSPARGSLAANFLGYMHSTTSSDILRSDDYTPCVDRGQTLMNTLCHP